MWFYLVAFVLERMNRKVMGTARVHSQLERLAKSHRPINKTKGNKQEKLVFGPICAI